MVAGRDFRRLRWSAASRPCPSRANTGSSISRSPIASIQRLTAYFCSRSFRRLRCTSVDKIEDKSISDNDKKKIKTKTDVIIGEIKKSIEAIITDNSGDGFKQKSLKAKMEEAKKEIEELEKNGSENSCDLDSIDKLESFDDDIKKKIVQYKNILSKNDIKNLENISENIKSIINYCREEEYKS